MTKKLEGKIANRIARKQFSVLLREDFDDLGGYDQVGRALLTLTKKGKLVKIGYGLYAKAKVSSLTGDTVPIEPLPALAQKALDRLGAEPGPSRASIDYQQGRSTQVPTGRLISVNKRISRKIGDPVENAPDKLSALLWRVPDRTRVPQDDDPYLTRHLHDLAALQPYAAAHAAFRHLAIEMIRQDDDRCARTMGLPLEEKARVLLSILDTDGEYRSEYTRFVQGMSYAIGAVPTYDQAMAKLRILIDLLL